MTSPDTLRPPDPGDPTAGAYKDWLHLNLFDPGRDAVVLVNVSVHGRPGAANTQVVVAALVETADAGWIGEVLTCDWADAALTLTSLSTPAGSFAMIGEQVLTAVTTAPLRLRITATPARTAVVSRMTESFGTGWIGWRMMPRLHADGFVRTATARLTGPFEAYHDHNWGRWHWGDDIGWEWGSLLGGPVTVVFGRVTNRAHDDGAPSHVVLDTGFIRRTFGGGRVSVEWSGQAPWPECRRPGAAAALHADHRRPRLPGVLRLSARSGSDRVELEFTCRSVAQLILTDPERPGTSFLHELGGRFTAETSIGGRTTAFGGLGVVEWLS